MPNLFTSPQSRALIAPSILSADFTRMGEECRGVLEAGADALHLDVMDGHFAPNLTMGPDMCRWLRKELPKAFLDVHLMVLDPGRFIVPFVKAGANHLTFHVEVHDPLELRKLAEKVRAQGGGGMSVGLAINPQTPVERILPLVPDFDLILVMSVIPGFSGQKFMEEVCGKVRAIKPKLKPTQRLEMDGGIGLDNALAVRTEGCDVIVAATAIFGAPAVERRRIIGTLRGQK